MSTITRWVLLAHKRVVVAFWIILTIAGMGSAGTAVVSIMTTFLIVLGLTTVTEISPIVQFLVALIGLGVAIEYGLLVVLRWRKELAHGLEGDVAAVRATETAGRAAAFSGTAVAVGLLAQVALPLPFLRSGGSGGGRAPTARRRRPGRCATAGRQRG